MSQQEIRIPLPEFPKRFHNSPSIFIVYPQNLSLERTDDQRKRFLRIAVALEVISSNKKLLAIGQYYCDHYLRACKQLIQTSLLFYHSSTVRKYKDPTPTSPHFE